MTKEMDEIVQLVISTIEAEADKLDENAQKYSSQTPMSIIPLEEVLPTHLSDDTSALKSVITKKID